MTRRMLVTLAIAPLTAFALLAAWWFRSPPRIEIGRETTYLLAPARDDGTIDYAAAWRAEHGDGVTADNNAALLLFHAAGGDVSAFPTDERALLPALDPAEDLHPPESDDPATAGEWIDRMSRRLDVAIAASGRGRFYVPFEGPMLRRPHVWDLIPLQEGLAYRAREAARCGRTPALIADVGAILRIARLAGSWSFLGPFVQFPTERFAWEAARAVEPNRGRLSVAECRVLVLAADRTPFLDRMQAADLDQRLLTLDSLCGDTAIRVESLLGLLLSRADRNRMLRRVNEWFDRFAAQLVTHEGWRIRFQRRLDLGHELGESVREARSRPSMSHLLPDTVADLAVDILVETTIRSSRSTLPAFACAALDADIAMAEVAAIAWSAEQGRDPASTEELTSAIFGTPFRDRLTGSPLRFRRDDRNMLVAVGAAVDLRRELDALLSEEDR